MSTKKALLEIILINQSYMQVITLEEPALYQLIEKVIAHFKNLDDAQKEKWISPEEAMKLLNIKSKTSLQALRDGGKIRFSTPLGRKKILYDRESINEYLERNARETF